MIKQMLYMYVPFHLSNKVVSSGGFLEFIAAE